YRILRTIWTHSPEICFQKLECPVCMEYMIPSIFYVRMDNICNSCKPKLDKCPTYLGVPLCHMTSQYNEDIDKIFWKANCAAFNCHFVKLCLDEGNLCR
ncbi:hypothetical protein ANN_03438, partial [Periplaneta americana]